MLVESASQHYSTESVSRAAVWPPTPVFPQPTYRYPTNDEIQRYQIVLWFSIMIALVAIGAVYTLAFMPFKKDTMLYSSFNPNWEDRKRR
jgi:hypothetical protein